MVFLRACHVCFHLAQVGVNLAFGTLHLYFHVQSVSYAPEPHVLKPSSLLGENQSEEKGYLVKPALAAMASCSSSACGPRCEALALAFVFACPALCRACS